MEKKDIQDVIEKRLEGNIERSEIESVIDEKMEKPQSSKITITSINPDIQNYLNGFAVIREFNKIHMYFFDAEEDSLMSESKITVAKEVCYLESGYYVNLEEYVNEMMNRIQNQKPNKDILSFIGEDEEELTIEELLEKAFHFLFDEGAIYFGKDMKNKKIDSYQDLIKENDLQERPYSIYTLLSGLYVRRDLVETFFKQIKVKCIEKTEEDHKTK